MENKMYMTKKLADALLDALACLAISAIGGDPFDKETITKAERYARNTFCELCDDMEKDNISGYEFMLVLDNNCQLIYEKGKPDSSGYIIPIE